MSSFTEPSYDIMNVSITTDSIYDDQCGFDGYSMITQISYMDLMDISLFLFKSERYK